MVPRLNRYLLTQFPTRHAGTDCTCVSVSECSYVCVYVYVCACACIFVFFCVHDGLQFTPQYLFTPYRHSF